MKYKTGVIISIVVVAIIIAVSFFIKSNGKYITKVDRNLPDQQQSQVNNNLKEIEDRIAGTSKENISDQYDLYVQLGHEYYTLGDYAKERDAYIKASELMPINPDIWLQLFRVYSDMNDYTNAKASIDMALTLNPNNPETWLTDITFEKQKLGVSDDRIKELYTLAVSKTQNNVIVVVPYAQFLEAKGDLQGAYDYWVIASKASPKNAAYKKEVDRLNLMLHPKVKR